MNDTTNKHTISNGRGQRSRDHQASRAASTFSESGGHQQVDTHLPDAPALEPLSAGAGHTTDDTHPNDASTCTPSGVDDHSDAVTHSQAVIDPTPSGVDGHSSSDTHGSDSGGGALIGDLRELWRQRQDLHRAEKSLTLQIKAKCRRAMEGDKTEGAAMYKSMLNGQKMPGAFEVRMASEPFINARSLINAERLSTEKMLEKLAKQLPVWPWVESVRGFGALSLAGVIGETGDLAHYDNPSKVWKRMGLAVIGGQRQRRMSGADAVEQGYSPSRRSLVWNVGECLIKQQGHYREIYLARIFTECEKAHAEGLTPATSTAVTVQSWKKRGLPDLEKVSKIDPAKHRSGGHIHNRAKRYAEKRLLRDLWRAWRQLPDDIERNGTGAAA